jgi:hypothetical protein
MIMNNIIYLILISIPLNCAYAQTLPTQYEWKVTLKVVDETGQPVAGAKASVGYYSHSTPASIDGLTDTNGLFGASHSAHSGLLGFSAEKAAYYTTREPSYDLGFTYDTVKWNPTQTIVLKKIGRPIPMYAKRLNTHVPVLDKPMGFDLMTGDWMVPYGKGKDTDIIFTVHLDQRSENDFDYKLGVSFPNPGDGIQLFSTNTFHFKEGSELRSPHEALENGYEPRWVKTQSQKPGEPSEYGQDKDLIYFFRVRTIRDENGNVKSALYGKIYGDFMRFTYYLNPTPNSRNLEFDPKHNLMANLKPLEGVEAP